MKVSVIVCTYNRDQYLPTTLQKLAEQTSNYENFEVIIIDNNSSDKTAEISKQFLKENKKLNFRYILELNQGLTYARNRGILESKYDIVSFIDDDAFVRPDFIENTISSFLSNQNVSAIGGKIIPKYESKEPIWMTKYLLPLVAALDMGNSPRQFKGRKFPLGANMAFKKLIFEKYGIFNVELGRKGDLLEGGEEKEIFIRLKKGNETILYEPNVIVDHIIPDKRLAIEYIKKLAIGVGTSEKKRLKNAVFIDIINRVLEETIKIIGTIVLSICYTLILKPKAALILLRFRYWVFKGFISEV